MVTNQLNLLTQKRLRSYGQMNLNEDKYILVSQKV